MLCVSPNEISLLGSDRVTSLLADHGICYTHLSLPPVSLLIIYRLRLPCRNPQHLHLLIHLPQFPSVVQPNIIYTALEVTKVLLNCI